ncbi:MULTISPECIES: hypothetical protein [Bacillaceae]|uniref:hypothetical protein n=1 Tax=Bacillaceae TaxID=186817 RepID=UPI001E57F806|nr:hypothetical protein [Alteribacter populi]MCE7790896.1 hypothetical protein [Salipaludibacillus sp. CUR1]
MNIRIIEGDLSKKARSNVYHYLKELYRKEQPEHHDNRNLRSSIDGGTGEKRVQPGATAEGLQGESTD